jgi:catechol 2,3-dioxygenase-like lactoylglutathione lyase family enzyme
VIKALDLAIVTVADQDAAIEFWTEKLGFEKRYDQPYGESSRWVEVAPPGGEARLALTPPMREQSESGAGETGIAFTTDDLEAQHAAMREQGVDVDDPMPTEPPVPPMAMFRDPDGNSYLLVQRLDR